MQNFVKLFLTLMCLTFVWPVSAEAPAPGLTAAEVEQEATPYTEEDFRIIQISNAIKHLMKRSPKAKVSKDAVYRADMARDIIETADKMHVPVHLLTLIFYLESTYQQDAVGKKGELGLGQVMNPRRWGCDYSTRVGQMECSAKYLRRERKRCGSWPGALSSYGSSRGVCRPRQGSKLYRVVRYRVLRWNRLKRAFPDTLDNSI
jgi:hypothetical protein